MYGTFVPLVLLWSRGSMTCLGSLKFCLVYLHLCLYVFHIHQLSLMLLSNSNKNKLLCHFIVLGIILSHDVFFFFYIRCTPGLYKLHLWTLRSIVDPIYRFIKATSLHRMSYSRKGSKHQTF